MSTVSIFCPGQAAPAFVYAATAVVLIVLAICGQLRPHLGGRMEVVRTKASGVRHGGGPLGRSW